MTSGKQAPPKEESVSMERVHNDSVILELCLEPGLGATAGDWGSAATLPELDFVRKRFTKKQNYCSLIR